MINPHTELVNETLIELSKINGCRAWKSQSLAGKMRDRFIHVGVPGLADISGILSFPKHGICVPLFFEIKTGNATQSKEQIAFMNIIRNLDAFYCIVRRKSDVNIYIDVIKKQIQSRLS